ncbi:MAG: hypothetical protein JXB42_10085 [Deltaproteobacteria bacterium]|nr:hypothetical protein [Deltaproteobacteria bacterium]
MVIDQSMHEYGHNGCDAVKQDDIQLLVDSTQSLVNLQDKDPTSRTYGCFDRDYWAWKSKDMPNSTRQNAIYPLAYLASTDVMRLGPIGEIISEVIRSGLLFLRRCQRKNGAFDQVYPNENNVGTTAYAILGPLKAYALCRETLCDADRAQIESMFEKAGEFILVNDERYGNICNHIALCAHVCSLLNILLDDARFEVRGEYFLQRALSMQDEEGWFAEYGQPDPAYETQTLWHLTQYAIKSGDVRVLERCELCIDQFLRYLCHPDGTIGGNYTRRNNIIFYPAGISYLASRNPNARSMERCYSKSSKWVLNLDVDNKIRYLINIVDQQSKAAQDEESEETELPYQLDSVERFFKRGGYYVKGNRQYYSITSLRRGGCVLVWDKMAKIRHGVYGYAIRVHTGKWYSTNGINGNLFFEKNGNVLCVKKQLEGVKSLSITPLVNLIIRCLTLSILRIPFLSELFKKRLVRYTNKCGGKSKMLHTRSITFDDTMVQVNDSISGISGVDITIHDARNIVPFHSVVSHLSEDFSGWTINNYPLKSFAIRNGTFQRKMNIEVKDV